MWWGGGGGGGRRGRGSVCTEVRVHRSTKTKRWSCDSLSNDRLFNYSSSVTSFGASLCAPSIELGKPTLSTPTETQTNMLARERERGGGRGGERERRGEGRRERDFVASAWTKVEIRSIVACASKINKQMFWDSFCFTLICLFCKTICTVW